MVQSKERSKFNEEKHVKVDCEEDTVTRGTLSKVVETAFLVLTWLALVRLQTDIYKLFCQGHG